MRIFKVLTGGSATDAVVVSTRPNSRQRSAGLAKTFNHAPVDAAVAYEGTKIKQKQAAGRSGAAARSGGGDDQRAAS